MNAIKLLQRTVLGSLLAAAAVPAMGATCTVSFDGVASGTSANAAGTGASACGMSFHEGILVADVDANGDPILDPFGSPIPGPSSHWESDPNGSAILVGDPTLFGRGAAPSPSNALNALSQQVLLSLSTPLVSGVFSVTLDKSTYGDPLNYFLFLDSTGHVTQQAAFDQSGAGTTLTFAASNLAGIILPSNKMYDNISVSAVPLPAALPLFVGGLSFFGAASRRSRRTKVSA